MKKLFDICSCVIVYRSSPEEKAQIIKFVMKNDPNAFTCAIGDGANDINMIQTAHIGVGIEGNEGNQAAYFCDYAIPEFQGIRRLILWHGRGFGLREFAVVVPTMIFNGHQRAACLLWLNVTNGFSGITNITGYYYMFHPILNTNLIPLFLLAFDYDALYEE